MPFLRHGAVDVSKLTTPAAPSLGPCESPISSRCTGRATVIVEEIDGTDEMRLCDPCYEIGERLLERARTDRAFAELLAAHAGDPSLADEVFEGEKPRLPS